jgi:hypothetical protein
LALNEEILLGTDREFAGLTGGVQLRLAERTCAGPLTNKAGSPASLREAGIVIWWML